MLQGSESSRASCRDKEIIKYQMPTNLTCFMIDAEIAYVSVFTLWLFYL